MNSWLSSSIVELPQAARSTISRQSVLIPDPPAAGQDSTMCESSEGGLFRGKRFLLVGFGTEAETQLSELIMENSGKILVGRSRAVAHYAIVPLLGCDVEATVDEVVTDTWLVRFWINKIVGYVCYLVVLKYVCVYRLCV